MNRIIVYPGAIPLDTDLLSTNRDTMVALGALAQAVLGSATAVSGLAVGPNAPAAMNVVVGPGAITAMATVDATAYGSLAADTSDPLVKMGMNLAATTLAIAAPTTSGYAQNYLIEAAFLEQDAAPVVLPYYNAANPSAPYLGPGNGGTAQNTLRAQTVQLQAKAGVPATAGTQATPAVDAGWVPLAVVTVSYGQGSITAANIAVAPGAPLLDPLGLGRGVQPGRLLNVQRFPTAGSYTYSPTPGTNTVVAEVQAGGGAGGGCPATAAGQVAASGGGAGGGWARKRITAGFAGQTVTVGGGGAAAAGAAGGNGGASSFGAFVSASGGDGAPVTQVQASGSATTYGGSAIVGSGSGGDENRNGGYGMAGITAANGALSGFGGMAGDGHAGAVPVSTTSAGNAATNPGSGGSGAVLIGANGAAAGGSGAGGYVAIYEYT